MSNCHATDYTAGGLQVLAPLHRTTPMKAHLIGFAWELGNGIALDEFFEHLGRQHNVATRFGAYDRLLYISERGDYHLGLLLTVKDQKKVCEIQQAGQQYVVSVRSLADNSNLVDFNFFAVNKSSAKGLYQHYHHSCSLNQFGLFCKRHHEDLKDAKITQEGNDILCKPSPNRLICRQICFSQVGLRRADFFNGFFRF